MCGWKQKHVVGVPEYLGGSGDSSPVTAHGVLVGIKAALKHKTGKDSLKGTKLLFRAWGMLAKTWLDF